LRAPLDSVVVVDESAPSSVPHLPESAIAFFDRDLVVATSPPGC